MRERNRTPSVVAAWGESLRSKKALNTFPCLSLHFSVSDCKSNQEWREGDKGRLACFVRISLTKASQIQVF